MRGSVTGGSLTACGPAAGSAPACSFSVLLKLLSLAISKTLILFSLNCMSPWNLILIPTFVFLGDTPGALSLSWDWP